MVADRAFTLPPLVLGQVQRLVHLLHEVRLPEDLAPLAVVATLGDKLADLLAVVLLPTGGDWSDKAYRDKLPEMAAWLADHMPAGTAAEVVTDFFAVNADFFATIKAAVGKTEVA
jgi:hypothetical protein